MERVMPLRRTTLSDEIAAQLMERIRQGDLKPGHQLPTELELAQLFDVGRTTVREALKALSAKGIVERTRRGTVVCAPDTDQANMTIVVRQADIREVYEARLVLESALAEKAAERATEEEIHQLRATAAQLEAADPTDSDAVFEADMAFHYRVAELANNSLLHEMLNAIRPRITHALMDAALLPEVVKRSINNHRRLIDAIAMGDPTLAARVVRESLTEAESEFLRSLSARPHLPENR